MATKSPALASPSAAPRSPGPDGPAFELKGQVASLTVLRLRSAEIARIEDELASRVAPFPQIFLQAPVLVDVGPLEGAEVPWARLLAALRGVKLVPVGIAGATPEEAERSG